MLPVPSLLQTIVVLVVATTVTVAGEPARVRQARPADHLEKIETQDPGYLKLPVRILERSTHEAMTFDPRVDPPATVSFRLTRPAEIRVRITRTDRRALVLRTLLDWTTLDLGKHELSWDGRDASGAVTDNRMAHFVFERRSPRHRAHQRERCHELALQIVRTTSGSGPVEARLVGEPAYGPRTGYTLRAFVDWQPWFTRVFPGEAAVFELPDPPLRPGESAVLVLNLSDGEDHIGVASAVLIGPGGGTDRLSGSRPARAP